MTTNRIEKKSKSLPVVDCQGCGVCCFHMGYPAFILPREPMSESEIENDSELAKRARRDPKFRDDMLNGHPGEKYWHQLPPDLKSEWQAFVSQYQLPEYGNEPSSFDGPCIWLNMETRLCKHHQFRPSVCRDFDAGSRDCHDWRRYYQDQIETPPNDT